VRLPANVRASFADSKNSECRRWPAFGVADIVHLMTCARICLFDNILNKIPGNVHRPHRTISLWERNVLQRALDPLFARTMRRKMPAMWHNATTRSRLNDQLLLLLLLLRLPILREYAHM